MFVQIDLFETFTCRDVISLLVLPKLTFSWLN